MDSKAKQKLQELFTLYAQRLPQKIEHIEHHWCDLLRNWDTNRFKDFHREVHSLGGSAGTYGYDELGKTAKLMDSYLKTLLEQPSLSATHEETITGYLERLKAVLTSTLLKNPPSFKEDSLIPVENRLIYILEQDKELVSELSENLKYAGYEVQDLQDLSVLNVKMTQNAPVALIMDTEYLAQFDAKDVLAMQKQQSEPVQLFCIVPNGELMPRIAAVRAGCDAFFQKPVDVFDLTQTLNQKCSITGESYKILIIDDEESLADYYSLILRQAGMITHSITNPMLMLEALETFKPDLLLMDIYMPGCTGLELAAVLRQETRYTKLPIIFFSTEEDRRKQLSALSLGGDDFLTKPIMPAHLISAVRSRSRRANVLNYFMTTDSLTGLLNHSSVLKRLEIEIDYARQRQSSLSCIMVDIDHFKKINDTFGHPVGDVVIKKLATLLSVRLRNQDSVGRYGGEEFVLILPGSIAEHSKERCDNLRAYFSQYQFTVDEVNFFVTFSAGIASFDPESDDAQTLIEKADKALYQAKQFGRNQVVVYSA